MSGFGDVAELVEAASGLAEGVDVIGEGADAAAAGEGSAAALETTGTDDTDLADKFEDIFEDNDLGDSGGDLPDTDLPEDGGGGGFGGIISGLVTALPFLAVFGSLYELGNHPFAIGIVVFLLIVLIIVLFISFSSSFGTSKTPSSSGSKSDFGDARQITPLPPTVSPYTTIRAGGGKKKKKKSIKINSKNIDMISLLVSGGIVYVVYYLYKHYQKCMEKKEELEKIKKKKQINN